MADPESKRHLFTSSQSEMFSTAAHGRRDFILNKAASARKFGVDMTHATADGGKVLIKTTAKGVKKVGKGTKKGVKKVGKGTKKVGKAIMKRRGSNDSNDESFFETDDDEDDMSADDFRWSIRPNSRAAAALVQQDMDDSSSRAEDEDEDEDCYIDENPTEDEDDLEDEDLHIESPTKIKKESNHSGLGKSSTHSQSLGTISEDEDNDFASEDFSVMTEATGDTTGSGKRKKKKKKKKAVSGTSPKRKLRRARSEKPGRTKSLDDTLIMSPQSSEPKRGALSRSKSSQSARHVGGRDIPKRGLKKAKSAQSERKLGATLQVDEDLEVPRRTIKKAKSKRLQKGQSKAPMKVDFSGQVVTATDDEASDDDDDFDTEKAQSKKMVIGDEAADNSESESQLDPIAKANRVAQELSGRSLEGLEAAKKEAGALDSFLLSGHNEHVLGEEDSYFKSSRTSWKKDRSSISSLLSSPLSSSGRKVARPNLANKLRSSIFSETGSFMDESDNGDSSVGQSTRNSLHQEKERVSKLLDELESYEKELSQEHQVLELEREALEFELDKQTNKNQQLEATIEELQSKIEELESALKSQDDDQMLEVENEILRKRLEQKEEAMLNMTSMQNLNASSSLLHNSNSLHSSGPNLGMNSFHASGPILNTNIPDQMLSTTSMHSVGHRTINSDLPMVGEDEDLNAHMSMGTLGTESDDELDARPTAKLQGDLLQARAKLTEKDRIIKAQAEEIKSLQREAEDYKDDDAREKMKSYIEGLEKEKKFFMAEIGKLKKSNEKASKTLNGASNHSMGWGGGSNHSMPFFSAHGNRQSITSTSSTHMEDEFSHDDSFSVLQLTTNRRGSAATQQAPINRRQSGTAWRSFSTRLFGGDPEEVPPQQSEAEKMLDDLTNDL